jgi:hypothetical protein
MSDNAGNSVIAHVDVAFPVHEPEMLKHDSALIFSDFSRNSLKICENLSLDYFWAGGRAIVQISIKPARTERHKISVESIKQHEIWWTSGGKVAPRDVKNEFCTM